MTTPCISVVMPVYNALPYLPAAVESILRQTFADFEFLIFDDASTDGSGQYLDTLTDPRVRVFHLPKQGYGPLLNLGLQLAQGCYIARMDADDISSVDRFAEQLKLISASESIVACGCQAATIDKNGNLIGELGYPTSDFAIRFMMLGRNPFAHPGIMYRRDAVCRIGGYIGEYTPVEDYELWSRLCEYGTLMNSPKCLLRYRIHGRNVSTAQSNKASEFGDALSVRYVLRAGVAKNSEEAMALVRLVRLFTSSLNEQCTLANGELLCHCVQQCAAKWPGSCEFSENRSADTAWEIRQLLRWQFLKQARRHSVFAREHWKWLGMARSVDPREMKIGNVAFRVAKRAASQFQRLVVNRRHSVRANFEN